MMREFLLKNNEHNLKAKIRARNKDTAIIHAALREYPEDPFWKTVEGKGIAELSLKDVYHSKMSD